MDKALHNKTLTELSTMLRDKAISSVELTQHYLNRINTYDATLNSFITVCHDHALTQAQQADQLIAQGQATPLTGIPIAHKDIFCTQGIKTSCGSKMLDNFVAPYQATVVDRCQKAGTVMLGKTNMDEFAMGSSNENSYYGPVKNPWDITMIPGGSSGGSAAAVAARLTPAATGTDTGGSIRQPAALCGITGLKPTYGRVSRYGMIAFASSLDQGGPMTPCASDAAMMLNAMAGHDTKDSTSIDRPVPDYTSTLDNKLNKIKIGIPHQYFNNQLDPHIQNVIDKSLTTFKQLGVEFVDIDLPHTEYATSVYYVLAPAECSSNLARYDGVRYGYRCEHPQDLVDLYRRSRSEGFGDEVKRRIMVGTYVLSAGYYDAYYRKAQQVRRLIRDDFTKAFEQVDLILTPASPSTAFKLGERLTDPIAMYLSDIYTIAANLAGIPAIAFPGGFHQQLPIGIQLMGNYFCEALLLNAAHQFQQVTDWHQHQPAITDNI